jgi:ATP-dependent Clp protease ATP-binding subunit ClpC
MLLQIMEEGRLTDSFGRKIDFRNVILIMTSNVGATSLAKKETLTFRAGTDETRSEDMKHRLQSDLERQFRPEFINRLDEVIFFEHLTKDDIKLIIDIEMKDVYDRIEAKGMSLTLQENAKEFLLEKGYSERYGARPMRRCIERFIEDPLSEEILKGTLKPGCTIDVVLGNDELVFDILEAESNEDVPTAS